MISLVLILAAAAAAIAASGVLAHGGQRSSERTRAATTTGLRCPTKAPRQVGRVKDGGHVGFVTPGATFVLLCRYQGLNASPKLGLARAQDVRRRASIQSLTRRINALPRQRAALFACPVDDDQQVMLTFDYPQHADERVTIDLRGCGEVSNGHTATYALPSRDGAELLAELRALAAWRG